MKWRALLSVDRGELFGPTSLLPNDKNEQVADVSLMLRLGSFRVVAASCQLSKLRKYQSVLNRVNEGRNLGTEPFCSRLAV